MANQWLRLWHDMPNDPKWRTIARVSKQRIGDVLAVYLHVLVDASSNESERGRTQSLCIEDVATALDMEIDQVEAILSAMQGRVMEGDRVAGWSKRQPAREDGSAERAKAWRERQKERSERERTQENAEERQDKDKDKDKDKEEKHMSGKPDLPPGFVKFWSAWPSTNRKVAKAKCLERWRKAGLEPCADAILAHVKREKTHNRQWRDGYEPAPLTYLNQRRWEDGDGDNGSTDAAPGDWWQLAGFGSLYEAENSGCNQFIYQQFRDGQRIDGRATA